MHPGSRNRRLRRRVAIVVALFAALAGVAVGTQAAMAHDVVWGYGIDR